MERVDGIEPTWPAWKAGALPLSYTRSRPGIDRLCHPFRQVELAPPAPDPQVSGAIRPPFTRMGCAPPYPTSPHRAPGHCHNSKTFCSKIGQTRPNSPAFRAFTARAADSHTPPLPESLHCRIHDRTRGQLSFLPSKGCAAARRIGALTGHRTLCNSNVAGLRWARFRFGARCVPDALREKR